jgi:hypothetical protein
MSLTEDRIFPAVKSLSVYSQSLLLALAGCILLLPIPHTIAARLLIVLGLAAATITAWPAMARRMGMVDTRNAVLILGILTVWLLINIQFFSLNPAASWREFIGDWLRFIGLILIGAALVEKFHGSQRLLVTTAYLALFCHVIGLIAYQLWLRLNNADQIIGVSPFGNRDTHSTLVMLAITLPLADLTARRIGKAPLLLFKHEATVWAHLLFCLVATASLNTRNGTVAVFLTLLVCWGILVSCYVQDRKRLMTIGVLSVCGIAVLGVVSWKLDSRWQGLASAIEFALDIENHRYWLTISNEPTVMPTLANGVPVEESAYMRMAWAKVSANLILEHPFGVGFGHRAFGWAVFAHYGVGDNMVSSHSGLLDFTLANGIPGIVLWLTFAFLLMKAGWRRFFNEGNSAGLALFLFVLIAYLRFLVDGHMSGWRFEIFSLILGLLLWKKTEAPASSKLGS